LATKYPEKILDFIVNYTQVHNGENQKMGGLKHGIKAVECDRITQFLRK